MNLVLLKKTQKFTENHFSQNQVHLHVHRIFFFHTQGDFFWFHVVISLDLPSVVFPFHTEKQYFLPTFRECYFQIQSATFFPTWMFFRCCKGTLQISITSELIYFNQKYFVKQARLSQFPSFFFTIFTNWCEAKKK